MVQSVPRDYWPSPAPSDQGQTTTSQLLLEETVRAAGAKGPRGGKLATIQANNLSF